MGALFTPKVPALQPVTPMANPDSPDVIEAKRRAALEALQRSGRTSTIMTNAQGGTGREYSATKLGTGC